MNPKKHSKDAVNDGHETKTQSTDVCESPSAGVFCTNGGNSGSLCELQNLRDNNLVHEPGHSHIPHKKAKYPKKIDNINDPNNERQVFVRINYDKVKTTNTQNTCFHCLTEFSNCVSYERILKPHPKTDRFISKYCGGNVVTLTITDYVIFGRCGHFYSLNEDSPMLAANFFVSGTLIISDRNKFKIKMGNVEIGPVETLTHNAQDSEMLIITDLNKYLLALPSDKYPSIFHKSIVEKFYIANTVITILLNSKYTKNMHTYDQFILMLEKMKLEYSENYINEIIIQKYSKYICQKVKEIDEQNDTNYSQRPCIIKLKELSYKKNFTFVKKTNDMIKSKATATPLVERAFRGIFHDEINTEINKLSDVNVYSKMSHLNKSNEPQTIRKSTRKMYQGKVNNFKPYPIGNEIYYNAVYLGDCILKVGDFVSCDTKLLKDYILQVTIIWEESGILYFHCRNFIKSYKTILGDVGNPKEIFMTDECSRKLTFKNFTQVNVVSKMDLVNEKTNYDFKYDKRYSPGLARFENLSNVSKSKINVCQFCELKCSRTLDRIPYVNDVDPLQPLAGLGRIQWNSVVWQENKYFRGMGVFLPPHIFNIKYYFKLNDTTKIPERTLNKENSRGSNDYPPVPYAVGCIDKILTKASSVVDPIDIELCVYIMARSQNIDIDDEKMNSYKCDTNMLFWTNEMRIVKFSDVVGPCSLSYLNNIKKNLNKWSMDDPNRFYFKNCYNFNTKSISSVPSHATNIGKTEVLEIDPDISFQPLNTLDLFAGCGGLSSGLEESGLIKCKWAVEIDTKAAESIKKNVPNCNVYTMDCNEFLQQVMENKSDNFPKQGDVEMICCGPPCQGYSSMNRFSNGLKSTFNNSLIVTTMSFVDYFRPKYFILENVRDFVLNMDGMIMKTTLHCLLQMGYQCSFAIIQAGSFGLPQARRRLFIIAADSFAFLPQFPLPTHSFNHTSSLTVNIDDEIYGICDVNRSAPRRTITVRDAINDLPHIEHNDSAYQMCYDCKPKSEFQRMARSNCSDILNYHMTKPLNSLDYERVSRIPLIPGSDWRSLPNIKVKLDDGTMTELLKYEYRDQNGCGVCRCYIGGKCRKQDRQENTLIPWFLPHTANKHSNWVGVMGRIGWDDYFSTTLTSPKILGTQGRVLHPVQHRIISVRECARSQGFPDSYVFSGDIHEVYKQIGNAVPPPLAAALGRQFIKALKEVHN